MYVYYVYMYYKVLFIFYIDTSLELVKVSSSVETYLNRKRLTTINYNSKIQETLDEIHPIEVPQTKSDTKYYSVKKYNNNNLCITGVTNGTICDLKLEKCKKIQNIIGMYILKYTYNLLVILR